ncbi:CxxC-x17-CxxC domain-containing protein [Bacteroidota bacterium]
MIGTFYAWCRKDTEIPFEPLEYRPVYCNNCYNTVRLSRSH